MGTWNGENHVCVQDRIQHLNLNGIYRRKLMEFKEYSFFLKYGQLMTAQCFSKQLAFLYDAMEWKRSFIWTRKSTGVLAANEMQQMIMELKLKFFHMQHTLKTSSLHIISCFTSCFTHSLVTCSYNFNMTQNSLIQT